MHDMYLFFLFYFSYSYNMVMVWSHVNYNCHKLSDSTVVHIFKILYSHVLQYERIEFLHGPSALTQQR
jgi:hypothetical protein